MCWTLTQEVEDRTFSSYGISEEDFQKLLPQGALHEVFRLPILLYIECYTLLYQIRDGNSEKYTMEWGVEQYLNGKLNLPRIFLIDSERIRAKHAQLDSIEEYHNRLLNVAFRGDSGPRAYNVTWYLKRILQMLSIVKLWKESPLIENFAPKITIQFMDMIISLSSIYRNREKDIHSLYESLHANNAPKFLEELSENLPIEEQIQPFSKVLDTIIAEFEGGFIVHSNSENKEDIETFFKSVKKTEKDVPQETLDRFHAYLESSTAVDLELIASHILLLSSSVADTPDFPF